MDLHMATENLESLRLLSLGMSCFLQNPHPGHYLVRHWSKKGWVDFLRTETFLARCMGWMLCCVNYCFVKGKDAESHCCLFFLSSLFYTTSQNKTFFHQFSVKENWLQHRGTMNETEESKYI